jgi:non-specific serine/threonine protein kinase
VATPNNLPAQLSSFVGRERQLAELRRLLRKSRLITLTGPGGAGKTRLALRLAADVLDRHPEGVWLVDLAPLSEPRLLAHTVAAACGIKEERRRPVLEILVEWLDGGRTLLILDGCEHLVDACAALVRKLLSSCPKLTVLVTSREPLGVPGELIWRTPSLSLPRDEDGARPELAIESEAIRLFVERARLSRPDFELGGSADAAAVTQICARLEGIPLAIELAASLARVMTLQDIVGRLHDRFRLLAGGSRAALPRHQTLRHAVDWSYGLLSPAEKELFARLSVFAGGFELSAAEAIAADDPLDHGVVLRLLSRLVDKSLVVAEPGGPRSTRYRMLDTIREYALEKLHQDGEAEARQRHARYFVDLCQLAAKELRGPDPLPWLRLDEEQANIRLALGWSMYEQPDDALRLSAAMGAYWHGRRHFAEGMEWLDQALGLVTSSLDARAAALWSRARIRMWHAEYSAARRDAEECADLSRELGLSVELGGALTILGLASRAEGDLDKAEGHQQEALQIAQQVEDHEGVARGLNNLALYASSRGDHERARTLLEEAVAETRVTGNRASAASIVDSLGRVCLLLGDLDSARRYYQESLEMSATFVDAINLAQCLEGIALLALAEKDAGRVVRLTAAAQALRAVSGGQSMPEWRTEVDEGLAAARSELGPEAFDAAWHQGAAMSLREAVRYASGSPPDPMRFDSTPLTSREAQVAALIAEGLTNAEIAKKLRMADRTADAHVEHIRNKLGMRSRAQIAVWAHERLGRT